MRQPLNHFFPYFKRWPLVEGFEVRAKQKDKICSTAQDALMSSRRRRRARRSYIQDMPIPVEPSSAKPCLTQTWSSSHLLSLKPRSICADYVSYTPLLSPSRDDKYFWMWSVDCTIRCLLSYLFMSSCSSIHVPLLTLRKLWFRFQFAELPGTTRL